MEELVKVKNKGFAKYEEVLLRRDNLRKEAENIHLEYIRVFGDLITESFRLKVECISKKKMISFCQWQVNHGKKINSSELADYIAKEMASYQKELADMISDVETAKGGKGISAAQARTIRTIYYRLVKLLHPDLHPELFADEVIKDYWHRIVIAYTYNDLETLEELEALVLIYLKDHGIQAGEQDIRNLDEKIAAAEAEIEQIISTEPYQYRFVLEDKDDCKAREESYRAEIESYKEYSKQLDEVLASFHVERMLS